MCTYVNLINEISNCLQFPTPTCIRYINFYIYTQVQIFKIMDIHVSNKLYMYIYIDHNIYTCMHMHTYRCLLSKVNVLTKNRFFYTIAKERQSEVKDKERKRE